MLSCNVNVDTFVLIYMCFIVIILLYIVFIIEVSLLIDFLCIIIFITITFVYCLSHPLIFAAEMYFNYYYCYCYVLLYFFCMFMSS